MYTQHSAQMGYSCSADPRHNQQLRTHYTKHRHTHQSAAHNTTARHLTRHHNNFRNTIQLHNLAHNTHTKLDHLPIITTINKHIKYKLQQNRHPFTNYRKVNWTQFITDREAAFSDIQPPPDIHTSNTIFTNIILHAYKHNIPKVKIHSTCKLLPEHIRHKIEHRNKIRAQK